MRIFKMTTFFCLLLISACENDPYPKEVDFEPVGESERRIKKSQKASLFLQMQSVMQFVEGEERVYEIKGVTPSGGPSIAVFDLPQGADFDPDTGQLRWNPDFTAGDSADINAIYREYPIKVQLNSLEDDLNFLERTAVLLVFNTPQDVLIEYKGEENLNEGIKYTQKIEVSNQDSSYYRGDLYSIGLPQGVTLKKSKSVNGVFSLSFTPKFNFVTTINYDGKEKGKDKKTNKLYRDIHFSLHAVGNQGHVTTKIIHWRVWDKNKVVKVFTPTEVKASDSLRFSILIHDPNEEYEPRLSILNKPSVGKFNIKKEYDTHQGKLKIRVYHIIWQDIPLSYIGLQKELKFKACGHYNRSGSCHEFSISAHFEIAKTRGPKFNRLYWPLGSIKKYELHSPPLQVFFPIRDPDTGKSIKEIVVEVSSPNISVNWKWGKLLLSATEAGIYQFNVKAKTFYGVEGSESMMVEVINPVEETSNEETSTNTEEGAK